MPKAGEGIRLGMFGGTFNPPHIAHLIAAEIAREAFALDTLLFVPANIPPHKVGHEIASAEHRLGMTRLAVEGNHCFRVSEVELQRPGRSYTIDTILKLKQQYAVSEFFLFIGLDNLAIFDEWHRSEDILAEATVVVISRPTHDLTTIDESLRKKVLFLPIPLLEISSTDIRKRVNLDRSIRYLVPDAVGAYIEKQKLYK